MADWLGGASLRVRLSLLVAIAVAAVVTALTYFQLRAIERTIGEELLASAELTARAAAEELARADRPLDEIELREALHEFAEANAAVRALTVVAATPTGPTVLASTSSEERAEAVALAARAMAAGRMQVDRAVRMTTVALPVRRRQPPLGVVVTISMNAVWQARRQGRAIAVWFAAPAIVLLTLLVDLLAQRLVHRPLAAIRATMVRVGEGDLGARAPVVRRDELGSVAEGLNRMLARMENFNVALQDRVREATEQLRLRNAELEESYRRALALHEALARAERMATLGQAAASVAHQIGTPLNLIAGYIQVLREDPQADAKTRRRLEIVERQIEQVKRVVRSLLDQARQPPRRELTSVRRLVERACETARPRLERARVELVVRLNEPLPPVEADVAQLELALLNLIANSLDAMPAGGTLAITATPTGDGVRLEVADTGSGIPADVLPRVFEPWVTTKPVGQGTGLGLAIVRDVVKGHGGSVSARNGPQGGAIITVDLPAAPAGRA
ncbi:MAG TPA: ATP-binding protein [Vicinamibacterales bacterium]|nr:ATP-binding protein [Vicinamibacterales bacterium]